MRASTCGVAPATSSVVSMEAADTGATSDIPARSPNPRCTRAGSASVVLAYPKVAVTRGRLSVFFAALVLVVAVTGADARTSVPVLGKWKLTGRYGAGWGTAHPPKIDNGGVPSGKAWGLHWTNWGAGATTAHGFTWLYRPNGGYYAKPGAIDLRAYRLGQCRAGGPPAYTRLAARVATRPGGALGHWFAWGGWRTLCRWP
jgi:hypothetical protein